MSTIVQVHWPGGGGRLLLGEEGNLGNLQDVLELFRHSGRYLGNLENLNICTLDSGQWVASSAQIFLTVNN